MARSAEQTESGWLSIRDTSLPGLLSSSPEPKLSKLLSAPGELPPVVATVGAGGPGVPCEGLLLLLMVGTVLAGALLGTVLAGILWSGTKPVGTLGGTVAACIELMGNLDGARLVSTLVGFELVGNLEGSVLVNAELGGTLEGTVLVNAELGGTLEGTVLVVIELLGTLVPLVQMIVSAWSPARCAEGKPVEEKLVPVDTADTGGPGKQLALGVERARGWKETVGDTGPWGVVMLGTMPAVWALPSSVSCS